MPLAIESVPLEEADKLPIPDKCTQFSTERKGVTHILGNCTIAVVVFP